MRSRDPRRVLVLSKQPVLAKSYEVISDRQKRRIHLNPLTPRGTISSPNVFIDILILENRLIVNYNYITMTDCTIVTSYFSRPLQEI